MQGIASEACQLSQWYTGKGCQHAPTDHSGKRATITQKDPSFSGCNGPREDLDQIDCVFSPRGITKPSIRVFVSVELPTIRDFASSLV